MGKVPLSIGALVSRYAVVVTLPSIVAVSIFADLRHTRLWKKSLEEASQKNLASN